MIAEWLAPIIEWTGLSLVPLLLFGILLLIIFKD